MLALTCVAGCGKGGADDDGRPVRPIAIEREAFGMNGHVLRALSAAGEEDALATQLVAIAREEITFVRASVDWVAFEPEPPLGGQHQFEYGGTDAWVRALAEQGLRWYVVGVGASTPAWAALPAAVEAGCGGRAPPAEPGHTAAMMAAIAERYGRAGTFWSENPDLLELPVRDYEVWNEPNHGAFWCPAPNPAAFAEHLMEASAQVRAVDRQARIVLGGLAPFHETISSSPGVAAKMHAGEFLAAVLAAEPGLESELSAVGVHTYGEPSLILSDLAWFRSNLDAVGLESTPMHLNEVGWTTAGADVVPVPEGDRVGYMEEIVPAAIKSNCLISSIAPHTWVTEESDPLDPEDWFGLAEPGSGRPYPSGRAYGLSTRALTAERDVPADGVKSTC
jgi:polysaccharide biosynthesis protein PslG